MKKYINTIFTLSFLLLAFSSDYYNSQPDLSRFKSSANNWYNIHGSSRIIRPLPDIPKYKKSDFVQIADNILLFQKVNGGWAKNFDMQAVLDKEQRKKVMDHKKVLNTTFDNGATHSQLTYLAEVFSLTGADKYKEAFFNGLKFVLDAQYENGGWPQVYPDTSGYRKYITFNDGAMMGVIKLLHKIIYKDPDYLFVDTINYLKAKTAFDKGLNCILNTQIVENGEMNSWCQQHDHETLMPQNARSFEPAAICNGESSEIVLFLMRLDNPDERLKKSIRSAVNWFEKSAIYGIRVEIIDAPKEEFAYHTSTWDRKVVKDPDAPRIWTRFYELGTHVPLFCRRDGVIVYSLAEVERERRTGYSWYNYHPEAVLKEFPVWQGKWDN